MKEANSVIGRKGKYKNLTKEQSQKILKETNDHIFERDIPIDPEDFAQGGIAGMLGERDGYYKGSMAKSRPKKKKQFRMPPPSWMMDPPGYRKVYESLEDIPEEALALMKKDPNFDLQTFLETVKWSDPEETRIKKILEQGKYGEDDIPWGKASPWGQYLNYLPFGEKESIGDGLLSLKNPSDTDKAQTVMHEMRHSKMDVPWFRNSSAVPKWVQEYEGENYLDKDVKDKHSQYRDTQKDVSGEELYNRFLDQHFYPDAAKKGDLAGSDYEPYFDKILKDHWAPNLKAYKDILKEEKRVKSKPIVRKNPDKRKVYPLAQGGRTGSGLNYLLGEDDQNSRVPYASGSRKKSWTDRIAGWTGGKNVMAGEIGIETWDLLNNLLQSGGLYAEGGRTGFGLGGMSRRLFLKLMGAGAAGTAAAKSGLFSLLKGGANKSVIAPATHAANQIITTAGMPPWFKPLVNRVIKEGDDVTKKFATKDREIVHRAEIDKNTTVDVIQDLDTGNVRIEYDAADNLGYGPIQLDYKAGEIIEQGSKKGTKTKPEFSAVESEPRVTNWDGDIEFDGENIVSAVDDLLTDTTKLETYATGKKPNIKKLLKSEQKKKYVNKLHDDVGEQLDYIENKTGHIAPEDLIDEGDAAHHAYKEGHASGGRVPLAEGSTPSAEQLQQYYEEIEKQKREEDFKNNFMIRDLE